MVQDTLEDIEAQNQGGLVEGGAGAVNKARDFSDTASDLKALYSRLSSSGKNSEGEGGEGASGTAGADAGPENVNEPVSPKKDGQESDGAQDRAIEAKDKAGRAENAAGKTAEEAARGAEDAAEGAGSVAEDAGDATTTVGKGHNIAGRVGGEIGRETGGGAAKALGGGEEAERLGGEVGGEVGTAGGIALYDKYLGSKGSKAASETGEGAEAGAEATGTAGEAGAAGTGAETAGAAGGATEAGGTGAGAGAAGATAGGGTAAGAAGGAGATGAGTAAGTAATGGAAATEGGAAAAGGGIIAAVGWPVILIIIAIILVIIIILIIVAVVAPKVSYDKEDTVNQQTLASIESLSSSGNIVFSNPNADLKKIRGGEIGKPALDTINNLAKSHEQIYIHYTGVREYAPGQTKANDSFEFDITAVDKIKCTDTTANTQLIEFPIYLNLNYDWKNLVLPSYSDKIICAVGYYPKINSPISTTYSDLFSPGEFPIQELPERAKMAIQEKTAELIDEIISQDRLLGIESESPDSLLPVKITFDDEMMAQNFKHSTTVGLNSALKEKISQAYSKLYPDKKYNLLDTINNYNGLHVSYL